ncbi:GNAT family N-acetyltransferase [Blastococcus haudaquaticus]|uniref:GNAT family N-acetyltransferase n=1 Tax=Blastococcus haudaquaticus TaxID=1938745 RepID=UPI0013579E60|nr:GNAT family N-acetyltransferase [Blastococcus haudaquaticus]
MISPQAASPAPTPQAAVRGVGSLVCRFVPDAAIDDALVRAWQDLATRAAEPNPFAEAEVVAPALRHLGDGRRTGILAVGDGARLLAVLPVVWPVVAPLGPRGRLPLPLAQVPVQPYRPLGTPLVDADEPVAALDALLRPPRSFPAPALLIRNFGEDGPVAAALDQALAARGQRALRTKTYERALLEREGGPTPNKNRKNRYNRLRRHRADLAEALGEVAVVDRSEDPAAIEDFLRLEDSGWKGRAGTALAAAGSHATWFREVTAAWRAQGRLEVLSLEVAGRSAAMICNVSVGTASFHLKSAYDESLSDHRPGSLLVLHCVETVAGGPFDWRDSCTVPDNTLFNQLWPSRRRLSTVVVPMRGRTGTVAVTGIEGARWVGRLPGRARAALAARDADDAGPTPALGVVEEALRHV